MKRIEFIAPVEAMRGNLSGAQNLKYPTQNNKAFESPEGSVNYARNYGTRFIGAKRASDGLKYFAVKTKTATHITARSLQAMALLGGAGAMYAALVRDKSSDIYANIYAQWVELQNYGSTKTFRRYVMDNFRQMLATKSNNATFAGPRGSITVNNPWIASEQTVGVQVTPAILVKFWDQLSNGFTFFINGEKAISNADSMFIDIINSTKLNVLNLSQKAVGPDDLVTLGTSYVIKGDVYTETAFKPVAGEKYTLTDIEPTQD